MPAYLTTAGETVEYPEPAADVAAFLARAHAAAADPAVTLAGMVELVYGPANPILDRQVNPARPMVTKAVFENPVYRVLSDLVYVKQLQAAGAAPADDAAYTVSVADAAERLGITPASVRAAVTARKLDARQLNGQWYVRPEAVAAYKVSNRGRRRVGQLPDPAAVRSAANEVWTAERRPPTGVSNALKERADEVRVVAGSEEGASLSVRCEGLELRKAGRHLVGDLPAGWAQAVVRTTGAAGGVRAFVIAPAPGADERIELGGLSVRGAFRFEKKVNSAKAANEVWKAAAVAG